PVRWRAANGELGRVRSFSGDAGAHCLYGCLDAVVEVELGQDAGDVVGDCVCAQRKLAPDLLIALAARQTLEDLKLARGQDSADSDRRTLAGGGDRDVSLADAREDASGDLRGEHGFPRRRGPHGAENRLGGRALEYVPAGPGDDRLDHAILLAAGEHEDARSGGEHAEPLDRLDPRDPGKPQIHQHDVRTQLEDHLDRVLSVGGLADDIETATAQRLREGGADQMLVVNQNDGDRRRHGALLRWHLPNLPVSYRLQSTKLLHLQGMNQGRAAAASSSLGPLPGPF